MFARIPVRGSMQLYLDTMNGINRMRLCNFGVEKQSVVRLLSFILFKMAYAPNALAMFQASF